MKKFFAALMKPFSCLSVNFLPPCGWAKNGLIWNNRSMHCQVSWEYGLWRGWVVTYHNHLHSTTPSMTCREAMRKSDRMWTAMDDTCELYNR